MEVAHEVDSGSSVRGARNEKECVVHEIDGGTLMGNKDPEAEKAEWREVV
jgi:hypothetical protein